MITPIKKAHICAYCSNKTHIIDPSIYPNDKYAIITNENKWKCGNCQDREMEDIELSITPYSEKAQEIKAKRKQEEINKQKIGMLERRLNSGYITKR
jgi:hypothetical protein